jgi:hypothetical protein
VKHDASPRKDRDTAIKSGVDWLLSIRYENGHGLMGVAVNSRINLFLIIEGIGILVALFYVTVFVLYLWHSLNSVPPVFTLNLDHPNWTVANSNTKTVSLKEGIQIESVANESEYMLLTQAIVGLPGRLYTVSYGLKQLNGETIIGVYDNVSNRWITSGIIHKTKDELQFNVPANPFQIILQNGKSWPNKAILAELTIGERR